MDWNTFLDAAIPQTVSCLIGVLAALLGTHSTAKAQRAHQASLEGKALSDKRTLAGHRAMLAVEAQRNLAEALHNLVKNQQNVTQWTIIRVNKESVPRIILGEIEFLITSANNKNILPRLIGYQQNCDQLFDSLKNFADIRRDYEQAQLTSSPLINMYNNELQGTAKSIIAMFNKILTDASSVQETIAQGLKEHIPGFKPIYKI